MRHTQRASLPIQRRLAQAQHITVAHPIGQSQHDRRLKPVPGRRVQRLPRLVHGERPALPRPDARRNRQTGHVAAYDALTYSLPSARRSTVRMIRTLLEL